MTDRGAPDGWGPTSDDVQALVALHVDTLTTVVEMLDAGHVDELRRRAGLMLRLARLAAAKTDARQVAALIGWGDP